VSVGVGKGVLRPSQIAETRLSEATAPRIRIFLLQCPMLRTSQSGSILKASQKRRILNSEAAIDDFGKRSIRLTQDMS
jgi:hypothetical protein